MKKVVILQEYVPHYRLAFFEILISRAAGEGINIVIAAGKPNSFQAQRGDSGAAPFIVDLPQREFRVGGRRLVFRRTARAVRGADLVILEQARRNLDAYRLLLPRFLRCAPWGLWGHGRDYVESRSKFSRWLQSVLTRRADWFFAYTPGGAQYVENLGSPANRITTVMNSVDTLSLQRGLQEVSKFEQESFLRQHQLRSRVITFIGALDDSKRIPFLLQAAELLADKDNISLVIAGDGPIRGSLEREAAHLRHVTFVGRADDNTKRVLLSLSDILVIPGRVGLVAVDSLAAGVPIVSTDWPYHAPEFDYLEDGVTSLISRNSVDAYAETINEALSNEPLRKSLVENCLTRAGRLGLEAMSDNFLSGVIGALEQGKVK